MRNWNVKGDVSYNKARRMSISLFFSYSEHLCTQNSIYNTKKKKKRVPLMCTTGAYFESVERR